MSQFVRFSNCLVNLDNVLYAWVKEVPSDGYSSQKKWKFEIKFADKSQNVTWTRKTEAEAQALMDDFEKLTNPFVIPEFP